MVNQSVLKIVISAFMLYCPVLGAADDATHVYEKASAGIVLIKTDKGAGTGFTVSGDGTIVTARHVVDGATKVAIKTQSGDIYDDVSIVAEDERRDIAILKINGFDLPIVSLGNSNDVKPGDRIFVIGNPLGAEKLKASISDGIVSGLRDLEEGYKVLQLTAPVSPGNSGGPVLNESGQAIGIIVFRLREGENLNFAVPINYVRGLLASSEKSQPLRSWKKPEGTTSLFSEKVTLQPGKWKSAKTGAVWSVRIQTDHLYAEKEEPEEARKLGAFQTLETKKKGNKYVGSIHTSYVHWVMNRITGEKIVNKSCTVDFLVEISVVSSDRIEGRQFLPLPNAKFDSKRCRFLGDPAWQDLVLIPE